MFGSVGFGTISFGSARAADLSGSEDRWHRAWSEPVRTRVAAASIALIASGMASISPVFVAAPAEVVTESRWHQAWSEPVRLKRGLGAAQSQPALAFVGSAPFSEPVIGASLWHNGWSEPVRLLRRLIPGLQPFEALVKAAPFSESVSQDRWHQPWSRPAVLARSGLASGAQQFLASPAGKPPAPPPLAEEFSSLVQSAELDDYVELYDLDATVLGGDVYRFTSTAFVDHEIAWNGNMYGPITVHTSGWAWNGQGPLPTPIIQVSNVSLAFGAAAIAFHDLLGATLTRTRTFRRFLDGQPEADVDAHFPLDIYRIDRKRLMTKAVIEWELAAVMDQQGLYLPRRPVLRNACTHRYRRFDVNAMAFDYTHASCPYAGSAYFTEIGATTTDPAADHCGKRLSDCKLRFGLTPLPTRAFPGVART